ncbi:MAG: hypothetical protein VX916_00525 [Planctomycetota bacterium]|nr:hypothetical protein [Planctomycetota bacterium]
MGATFEYFASWRCLQSILSRSLFVPQILPIAVIAVGASWLGVRLASSVLGGTEGFVGEVRDGAFLFSGALTISLAEPLGLWNEARAGMLTLTLARADFAGLLWRCVGLVMASTPVLFAVALVTGGWPSQPIGLIGDLSVMAAAGLFLGSFLRRSLLVPSFWLLLMIVHLRPWLDAGAGHSVAWFLPQPEMTGEWPELVHGALWIGATLTLANWKVRQIAGRAH